MIMHIRQEDRRPGLSMLLAALVIKSSNDRTPLLSITGTVSAGDSLARLLTRNAAHGWQLALPSCPSYCGGLDLLD
jgi:hypothetical protein